MIKKYVKLLRIKHYIKNILLFVPAFFAGKLFVVQLWFPMWMGFVAFSFMASVVYIVNDIMDVEKDRKHPVKCNRPIASGQISLNKAYMTACVLVLFAWWILSIAVESFFGKAHIYMLIYLVLNILYSAVLKKIPIVDVISLASGFLIRILYGAALTDIWVSKWLYLTVFVFSLYLGLGKRKEEIEKCKEKDTRKVLKHYTREFLDKIMLMCMSIGVVFYSLWSANLTDSSHVSELMIWTVPFVLAIVMRYEMIVGRAESFGDPVEVLYSDKILLGMITIYGVLCMTLLYGNL